VADLDAVSLTRRVDHIRTALGDYATSAEAGR
jgi:hypothetical protein